LTGSILKIVRVHVLPDLKHSYGNILKAKVKENSSLQVLGK